MEEKEEKPRSIRKDLDYLLSKEKKVKKKKFRLPRRGKISRSKLKKGFVTIMRVNDNGNVAFERQKVMDSTYRLSTKEYHATNEKDVLSYKGKPFIIQPTKKLNPCNPCNPLEGDNETYDQKLIMARMLGDTIKIKSGNAAPILWIIGLLIIGYVIYSVFTGGA